MESFKVVDAFLRVDPGPSRKMPFAQDLSNAFMRVVGGASTDGLCNEFLSVLLPFVVVVLC